MAKIDSQRLVWADVVRFLAIFFVVLVHSINTPSKDFISFPFASSIASVCVPLFVMLSGALLLRKDEGYKVFYTKRLFRLLLPWITWTIIYFVINYFNNPAQEFSQVFTLLSATFTSFWFLPMIAALYIITPALRIFTINAKPKDLAFLILIWFLSISLLPYYKNTMAFPVFVDDGLVRQTFSYLGFYLVGFLLTQIKLPKIRILFPILILGIISTITYYYFRTSNNLLSPSLAFNYIAPGVMVTSIALFSLILSLNKQLTSLGTKTKSLITSLSTAALGIYFIHGLVSEYFTKLFGFSYKINISYGEAWANALILFTISYFLIWGLTNIPYIKRFIT